MSPKYSYFNDVIKPSFPKLMDSWIYALKIDGLKHFVCFRELMASQQLCFENQWPQANYALKVYRLTRFMLSKIEGLMNLCIGKLIDSSKLALENIWTQANFSLEIDGLMSLCIGNWWTYAYHALENRWTQANFLLLKLMDYRSFYALGHLWPFYSVNTWDLTC